MALFKFPYATGREKYARQCAWPGIGRCGGQNETAGQRAREKERGTRRRTLFEESLCEATPPPGKGEIYGPAFVHEWSAHVQEVFKRRVLTSAYLHTSGLRKHLLKPLSPPRGLSESIRSLRSRFIGRSRIVEQSISLAVPAPTDR